MIINGIDFDKRLNAARKQVHYKIELNFALDRAKCAAESMRMEIKVARQIVEGISASFCNYANSLYK